jgi:hypothetical protein
MDTDDNAVISNKLKALHERAQKGDKESFLKTFKEVRNFAYDDAGEYKKLYLGWDEKENDMRSQINRVAEYVEIYGSYLYPQNPDAQVNAQDEQDQWALERFKLEEKVLDHCIRKGDLQTSLRRALNEALMSGRGMLWFGWNARKGIPYAVFDTVENFSVDPDARCPEEVNWVSRKRAKPRFEFERAVGENALIDLKSLKGKSKEEGDIIEYEEFYFRTGLYNYCTTKDQVIKQDGEAEEIDDSPKKYILCEGRLVAKMDWEIPFHMIDAWPCRYLDFRLQPEKLWPVSTIKPGLCHLKAMNWIYTSYLNRVKRTTHLTYARVKFRGSAMSDASTEDAMGVGTQEDGGIIDVAIPNGMDPDVKKLLQPLMLDAGMPQFELAWNITNRAFEDATGLNDLMRSGSAAQQLRTAADVDFKSTRSMSRVEDMRKQFSAFFNQVLESLSFIARYLMTSEDVAKLFGANAGALWGDIGTLEMKQQNEMLRMQQANMLMQQAIQQTQMAQMNMMPAPPLPTPEDIEKSLGPPKFVVMEEWVNSATREIEAGSMRPIDHDAQVQNLSFLFSSLAPVIAPQPGGAQMIAAAFVEFTRLNRYSADMQMASKQYQNSVNQAMMMPPPMGPTPAEPPMGASPKKPSAPPDQGIAAAAAGQFQ